LLVIPKIYPIHIIAIKNILLPFAVLDFNDLEIDIGQDMPKHITIIASNT
jgi:hypothetical protein